MALVVATGPLSGSHPGGGKGRSRTTDGTVGTGTRRGSRRGKQIQGEVQPRVLRRGDRGEGRVLSEDPRLFISCVTFGILLKRTLLGRGGRGDAQQPQSNGESACRRPKKKQLDDKKLLGDLPFVKSQP